ncbi:MAG: 50S ribosomal protein L30 [Candidatus Neomarinimicrobiota bacterium]|nr:MAG: 50S ribosomal protein L30 [Candidatus Neomarinimicrobiota bacterium]
MYSPDMAKTKQQMLKITQVKSRIGYKKKAKATLDAMGIKKMNQTVELPDNLAIRGMIKKIEYLIRVEDK